MLKRSPGESTIRANAAEWRFPNATSSAIMLNMSRSVLFGVLGGLAWFVAGLLIGHYAW